MQIILGKSRSGKSKYIFENIEKDIQNKKHTILFVPSQARLLAEKQYMSTLNKEGIIGVNITTIDAYVTENIKKLNLHLSDSFLSDMDKKMLLTQVLNENENNLNIFNKSCKKDGFLDILSIYMDIFRKNKIDIKQIQNTNFEDKILEIKLKEIANFYDKYQKKLNDVYIDSVDKMDIFLENIINTNEIKNTNIYFDGYNNFNKSEFDFIDRLVSIGANVCISLTTDILSLQDIYLETTSGIFEIPNKTYKSLLALASNKKIEVDTKVIYAKENGFNKLANVMFCEDKKDKKIVIENIDISIQSNPLSEIESIAIDINIKTRSGAKYSDFCIYTTDISTYENIINKVFYEYNIKTHIDTSKSIQDSRLGVYIMKLLELCTKKSIDVCEIMEILKLGLNDIEEEKIFELENYIYEMGINKYSIKKEFRLNNKKDCIYDLDNLNKTRMNIINIFDSTINEINSKKTAKEFIRTLYEHLQNNQIFSNYKTFVENITNENEQYNSSDFELYGQVWTSITDVLNSIFKVQKENKIDVKEFVKFVTYLAKNIKLKTIQKTKDQVMVIDINKGKKEPKKFVYFVGVNENSFPKRIEQDSIFKDNDLEKLELKNIILKENTISKINMQLFNIYEAISNTDEYLKISFPAANTLGKSLRKSTLIDMFKNVIDIQVEGNVVGTEDIKNIDNLFEELKKEPFKVSVFENLIHIIKYEVESSDTLSQNQVLKVVSLYNYYMSNKIYKDILEYEKNDNFLEKDVVEKLYKDEFNTSVSKLELFKKCPFSYFVLYVLGIQPRREFNISTMDTGNFFHDVLEKFSKYIYSKGIYWSEILVENSYMELKEEYINIINNMINDSISKIFENYKTSIKYTILKQKLIFTMNKVIACVAKSFVQSEFKPFGYEIEFREGKMYSPITINLADGTKMKLVGKIDRIDTLEYENATYVRVIDYKSSAKSLNLDDIKEGLSLQLVTYLSAFLKNMKESNENIDNIHVPAGMLYFNLSNNLVNMKDYTNDKEKMQSQVIEALRMKGIFLKDVEIIEKMDNMLNYKTGRLIDISARSLKGNSKKALEKEEFEKLCASVDIILKDIGEQVKMGSVKIKPNKRADYCKFCNYSNICRKETCI